jgi:VCBS repeat-containing protein
MLKKISPLLLLCSFELCADPGPLKAPISSTGSPSAIDSSASVASQIVAVDDSITVMPNNVTSVEGSVISNDATIDGAGVYSSDAMNVTLNSSPASDYGTLIIDSTGDFTYTLYKNSPSVIKLTAGQVATDSFVYTITNQYGQSATARLNVTIIGNPVDADGNTVFEQPKDRPYDNVDVEFNDRSTDATPLNSSRNIKGHLLSPHDRDWFYLHSAGNEVIKLDVCPQGSSCFGQKSRWVLYAFDSAKFTPEFEESAQFWLQRLVTETQSAKDLLGNTILSSEEEWYPSDDLYLAYRANLFDGALIGIIDPCFDKSNSLEIGVPPGERDYYIAISAPLHGNADQGDEECGQGSVLLSQPGRPVIGKDTDGDGNTITRPYATTQQYLSTFFSDDQYTIKVTGTGLDPLLSASAIEKSSTFNGFTSELNIPKVKVDGKLYEARLMRQEPFSDNTYNFALSALNELGAGEVADPFQATYNPANQQVLIPRVTDAGSGNAFSVVMQYHPPVNGIAEWLEAIAITPIK